VRGPVARMSLSVDVPAGSSGGGKETPASTRLARSLTAELDNALSKPLGSPTSGFLANALSSSTAPAPTGAWSASAKAAAAANERALREAQTILYDYCGANVQEILAEKTADDGSELLLVSWLGRCVPDKWVTRDFLESDFVSRGLLAAHDEDKQFEAEAEAEAVAAAAAAMRAAAADDDDDAFSVDDDGLEDDLSVSSSAGAAVDRVLTAFEAGDVHFSGTSHTDDFDLEEDLGQDEPAAAARDETESPAYSELQRQLSHPVAPRSPGGSVSFTSANGNASDINDSAETAADSDTSSQTERRRRSRRRRSRSMSKKGSNNKSSSSKATRRLQVPVGSAEITVDELPLDCRPYWSAFYSGYVKAGLPFERVARQLAGPSGRGRGEEGASLVTAGGVARMLCRLGMIGSHHIDLSGDGRTAPPPTPWRSLSPAQRARAMAEGTELLYETAELGRCDESFNGKEADRVITLSGFSLAILYYRIINDRTQLEPRRLFTIVEFLLFALPGQSVSQSPIIMATAGFHLLTSRYANEIGRIPRRMYEHVESRERYGGSYSFLQWLNSPLPLLPPQWTVL
jgi:hypothetical protein